MKTNKSVKRKSTNETSQWSRKGKNKAVSYSYNLRDAKSGRFARREGGDHLGGAGKKKE